MALALQKRIYDSTSSGGRRTLEYSSLGSLALNVDQIAAARRCFSESNRIATAVNPKGSATFTAFLETDNATIDLRIGDIRSAESGIARARSIFIAAGVKNRGLDALIHNAEAEVLLARGRVDSAIQHWLKQPPLPPIRVSGSEWLSLTPTNILSRRDGLARAYVKKGDLDAAIKEYERITTFDPASWDRRLIHPLHRHELAKLYEKKGLKEKAISQYEKVLAIWKNADADYPGPKDAKARLAKLRGGK
jgi:tetratricopeptide (TPR) repeat protein